SYVDRWVLAGPAIDAPNLFGGFGVYAEGLVQDRGQARGYGAYTALTWFHGPVSLLFEGKAYGDLAVVQPRFDDNQVEFTTVHHPSPPTVERLLQPLEHPQQDVVGGRLRADYRITDDVVATAAYGGFRDYLGYLSTGDPAMAPELRPGTVH